VHKRERPNSLFFFVSFDTLNLQEREREKERERTRDVFFPKKSILSVSLSSACVF